MIFKFKPSGGDWDWYEYTASTPARIVGSDERMPYRFRNRDLRTWFLRWVFK